MKALAGLFAGLLFGAGLAASGMTDTGKVLGFLDVLGRWQPDLAFVMGGAVFVTLTGFRLVLRRRTPFFSDRFVLPAKRSMDLRLLGGAAIFGVGWGAYGFCPGPALASLTYLRGDSVVFVVAMAAGMALASRFDTGAARSTAPDPAVDR